MSEYARQCVSPGCFAIVSGAAGQAGELCARELAQRGARLALVDIDKIMVNRLASELGADAYCFDVLSEQKVRQFMKTVHDRYGNADLLINAAGSGYVRTLGMMRVTSAFSRTIRDFSATVINIASEPRNSDPYRYASSDLAFHRLSQGLVASLHRPNLHVLTLGRGGARDQTLDALRQWHRGFEKQQAVDLQSDNPLVAAKKNRRRRNEDPTLPFPGSGRHREE